MSRPFAASEWSSTHVPQVQLNARVSRHGDCAGLISRTRWVRYRKWLHLGVAAHVVSNIRSWRHLRSGQHFPGNIAVSTRQCLPPDVATLPQVDNIPETAPGAPAAAESDKSLAGDLPGGLLESLFVSHCYCHIVKACQPALSQH